MDEGCSVKRYQMVGNIIKAYILHGFVLFYLEGESDVAKEVELECMVWRSRVNAKITTGVKCLTKKEICVNHLEKL